MQKFPGITMLLAAALAAGAMNAAANTPVSLNVAFDPDVRSYSATVANDVSQITVAARAMQPTATVTVNGGSPDTPVRLSVGQNTITIVVTSQDGEAWLTYTVTVTRQAAGTVPKTAGGYTVPQDLIQTVRRYYQMNRNNPGGGENWFRVLIAFGAETHATLKPFTVAEAEVSVTRWSGWQPVLDALRKIQAAVTSDDDDTVKVVDPQQQPGGGTPPDETPQPDADQGGDPEPPNPQPDPASNQDPEPTVDDADAASNVVEGTASADMLSGDDENNEMYGYGGNDLLIGRGGHDLLFGGDGNDTLTAGPGNDTLHGGSGFDTLVGGPGADRFVFSSSDTGGKVLRDFGDGDVIVLRTEEGAAPWPALADIISEAAAVGTAGYLYDLGDGLTVETTNRRLSAGDFRVE